jgi:lipoic acid synthetase
VTPAPSRLPEWVRKPERAAAAVHALKRELRRLRLNTVCESARCPNLHECFARGTDTFLILGSRCTRSCAFCAASSRAPAPLPAPPDPAEPEAVARLAAGLGLRHVVVTSVTRDDLPDGGASHFAATLRALRAAQPEARLEVLVPDFRGDLEAAAIVLAGRPDVFGHNLETVARLYRRVRPQARYERSLALLAFASRRGGLVKSGLMAGLGETPEEIEQALRDLRAAGVRIVTLGQYLQPSRRHLAVAEFIPPAQFDAWRHFGLALGFQAVFSGPLVRSSYLAEAVFQQANGGAAC